MKILWVNTGFLHPTTKGGQIRTLEMLRRLHARHEVHYAAPADPEEPEGPARASEYCAKAHAVPFRPARKPSQAFAVELAKGLFSKLPVSIFRWSCPAFRSLVADLLRREAFDCVVCDFLVSAVHFDGLERCVLFQHNVETMIWRRLAESASNPVSRFYLRRQAERMFEYEAQACRRARHVVTVSEVDAGLIGRMYGVPDVSAIPTGVDLDYFRPPETAQPETDLVFVGSMDYLPNIDGVRYFVDRILPLIRRRRPECSLTVAGRRPGPEIRVLAEADPRIRVTGTVDDVRPYLWNARVSIVPLRSGGGTRLKIYESMAAGRPVVSTAVGAEGLLIHPSRDILLADDPEAFAEACLSLLEHPDRRQALAAAALEMVSANFSWEQVVTQFEEVLRRI